MQAGDHRHMAQTHTVQLVLGGSVQVGAVPGEQGAEKAGLVLGIKLVNDPADGPGQADGGVPKGEPLQRGDGDLPVALELQQDAPGGVIEAFLSLHLVCRGAVGHAGEGVPRAQISQVPVAVEEGLDFSPVLLPRPDGDADAVACLLRPAGDHRLKADGAVFHGLGRGVEDGPKGGEPQQGQSRPQNHPAGPGQPLGEAKDQPKPQQNQTPGQGPPRPGQIHPQQQRGGKAAGEEREGHRRSLRPRM